MADGMIALTGHDLAPNWSANRNCLILGDLFDRRSGERAAAPTLDSPLDLEPFMSRYWGGYILFCRFGPEHHAVLRDPSGALGLYRTAADDIHCYMSDAGEAAAPGFDHRAIDTDFLRHWLSFPFLRSSRTGCEAVQEILPGEAQIVEPGRRARTPVWAPRAHTGPGHDIGDFDETARHLRARLLQTIPDIVSRHRSPLLQLSGGLDSSIICAALGAAGISFDAVNYFTQSPDGDERRFARAAADGAGARLMEIASGEASGVNPFLPRSYRPLPNLALRPLFSALDEIARERGSDALVDGSGGDNLFSYLTTAAPAVDAWRMKGRRAALETLDDLATLCGATFWAALAAALRRIIRIGTWPCWSQDRLFMKPEAVLEAADPHPWLDLPPDMLPGKREHVEALVNIQHFLDRGQPLMSIPMVHPLMAQPLLELCLSIPSWLWLRGGRDRAVARRAMDGLLPPAIAARRVKGRLESLFLRAYMARRKELADFLLDGRLVSMGILDRPSLERYLRQSAEPADANYVRVLEISALEEWISAWNG